MRESRRQWDEAPFQVLAVRLPDRQTEFVQILAGGLDQRMRDPFGIHCQPGNALDEFASGIGYGFDGFNGGGQFDPSSVSPFPGLPAVRLRMYPLMATPLFRMV